MFKWKQDNSWVRVMVRSLTEAEHEEELRAQRENERLRYARIKGINQPWAVGGLVQSGKKVGIFDPRRPDHNQHLGSIRLLRPLLARNSPSGANMGGAFSRHSADQNDFL